MGLPSSRSCASSVRRTASPAHSVTQLAWHLPRVGKSQATMGHESNSPAQILQQGKPRRTRKPAHCSTSSEQPAFRYPSQLPTSRNSKPQVSQTVNQSLKHSLCQIHAQTSRLHQFAFSKLGAASISQL